MIDVLQDKDGGWYAIVNGVMQRPRFRSDLGAAIFAYSVLRGHRPAEPAYPQESVK
jgi:hypothetical protein